MIISNKQQALTPYNPLWEAPTNDYERREIRQNRAKEKERELNIKEASPGWTAHKPTSYIDSQFYFTKENKDSM